MNEDKILDEIDREIENIEQLNQQEDKYWAYKKTFNHVFFNKEESRMFFVRNHLGSYVAIGMACHNTYNLKQRIIKNSISMTKSTNPFVVKLLCIPVGLLYFTALTVLWHIPSYTAEHNHLYSSIFNLLRKYYPPQAQINWRINSDNDYEDQCMYQNIKTFLKNKLMIQRFMLTNEEITELNQLFHQFIYE